MEQLRLNSRPTLSNKERPQLSVYMDYRIYLKDFYLWKRSGTMADLRPYSFAVFAAAADIRSPNYLKLVMEGTRNLSEAMAEKFARALGLNRAEAEEFKALVAYTQAGQPVERNGFLNKLNELRVQKKIDRGEMSSASWSAIPNWTGWVILQALDLFGGSASSLQIETWLSSKATREAVRKTVQHLIQCGFVVFEPETDQIKLSSRNLEKLGEMPSDLIRKIQSELILIGNEALFQDDPEEREVGSVTLSLSAEEFEQLKFELRHFRKKLQRQFASKEPGGDIYQVNFQMFGWARKSALKPS